MSLKSHLDNPKSPVTTFLKTQLPNTRAALASLRKSLQNAETIYPEGEVSYTLVGTALDYRLRYYFAITPFEELVAFHGADYARGFIASSPEELNIYDDPPDTKLPPKLVDDFVDSLDAVLRQMAPIQHRLNQVDEALLCRYCLILAYFEQCYRTGITRSALLRPTPKATLQELLDLGKESEIQDLSRLSWGFYEAYSDLCSKPAILNPTFAGSRDVGGADADLIVDGSLIDIKTTIDPQRPRPLWL